MKTQIEGEENLKEKIVFGETLIVNENIEIDEKVCFNSKVSTLIFIFNKRKYHLSSFFWYDNDETADRK